MGGHVSGLLNLAALAVALTLAYLGIDKVDPHRSGIAEGRSQATGYGEVLQQQLHDFAVRLDVDNPFTVLASRIFGPIERAKFYLVLRVAGMNEGALEGGILTFLLQLWYAPLLFYYSRRRDLIVVGIMAWTALPLFLLLTAATAWSLPLIDTTAFAHLSFEILTLIVIATLLHSIGLSRNSELAKSIVPLGLMLIADVKRRLDAEAEGQMLKDIKSYFESGNK